MDYQLIFIEGLKEEPLTPLEEGERERKIATGTSLKSNFLYKLEVGNLQVGAETKTEEQEQKYMVE